MRSFFVEDALGASDLISITGKEANHIQNVLRMKRGDTLIAMDGKGRLFEAIIEDLHHKEVRVKIIKGMPSPPPSPIEIHLAQALIKSRPMDLVIQKATELGVASITPFTPQRTAVSKRPENLARKMDHWQEIMKAACKQCGRPKLPALNPLLSFEALIENAPPQGTLKVLLWEAEKEAHLKGLLRSMELFPHIMAIVGPEGGFSPSEIHLARAAGFHIVSLGTRILRSETAAITLVSIFQYEWGDLNLRHGIHLYNPDNLRHT
jgi:16S rRNA (uracil1498-N3)-methyltransferase